MPELPKQHKLLMLQRSIQQKLQHLPHTMEPHLVSGGVELLERSVNAATLQILDTTEQQLPQKCVAAAGAAIAPQWAGNLGDDANRWCWKCCCPAQHRRKRHRKAAQLLQVFGRWSGEQLRMQRLPLVHTVVSLKIRTCRGSQPRKQRKQLIYSKSSKLY